jgi:hypothetical protein
MTAVEAESVGPEALDSWLADALARIDQRTTAVERREQAVTEREERIRAALAEAGKF